MNLFRAISNLLRFDRTNWKALALCFFTAGIFWTFNSLNKNYSTNVRFPLLFEYDEAKYISTEPLPATITLNVRGNGWDLLRKSLGLKVPNIALPLERPAETKKIVGSSLSPIVAGQIGTLQVNYIVSDTLRLKIEPKVSRRVKLIPDLQEVTFKNNYGRIGTASIHPDSALLEGPKTFIENLHDTLPVKVLATRINNSFHESIEVIIPHGELIKRNPPVAEIDFEVGLVEQMEHWIKLKSARMPWAVEIDRDSIRCLFLYPKKDHDRFVTDIKECFASVSVPELKKGERRSLLPSVTRIPSYSELLKIDSVTLKKY